jgi:uncharacterized membrane protein
MRDKLFSSLSTAKTTALGGVLFLIPVVVVAAALGYLFQFSGAIYQFLKAWLTFDSATGVAIIFGITIAVTILLCYLAGILAQRAVGRHFTRSIEQQLIKVYPKYTIYKDLLAGALGGKEHTPALRPVLVRNGALIQLAFEADRLTSGLVVIFFPGAPDAWIGTVALVAPEHVLPIEIPFAEALGICERMGRESSSLLSAVNLTPLSSRQDSSKGQG